MLEEGLRKVKLPSLGFSTIQGGALQVADEDDNLRQIVGQQPDGTNTVNVVNGPPPPAPLAPLVTGVMGGLRVYWDGTFAEALVAPLDFTRVTIHAVPVGEFVAPDPVDQTRIVGFFAHATGGEAIVSLPYGEHVVYLYAWSQSGKFSEPSATALGSPTQVQIPDIDAEITQSISDAATAASEAQTAAGEASDAAAAATTAANDAATAASNANTAALDAAGLAGSKGKVIIQSAAPAVADQLPQNLWIDTTGAANTPKRWDGDSWEPVTDKVAQDAATAAANAAQAAADAAAAAQTAQSRADEAYDAAVDAATAAGTAQTTANGKNTVWYQPAAPAGTGHKINDIWFDTDEGYTPKVWDGDSWEPKAWGHQSIATMDAGKITVGFLAAARIAANTINTAHLTVGVFSDNALMNPSFEDDLNGWLTYGVADGSATVDPTVSASGSKSIKLVRGTSGNPGLRSSPQPLAIGSGEWAISVRAKASAPVDNALTFRVNWLDADQVSLGFDTVTSNYDFTDTEWVTLDGQVGSVLLPPPDLARFYVVDAYVPAVTATGTTVWVDQFDARELISGVRIADGTVDATKVGADVIVANESYAAEGYIGKLKAEQIESGQVDATLGILGALEVGPNITVNPVDGIVIALSDGEIRFPADGSPAVVTAGINAKWLTVEDNLSIRGSGAIQGELSMANGIVKPSIAPTASSYYHSTPISAFGNEEDSGVQYNGLIEWSTTQYMVALNFFGGGLRYVNKDATYSWGFDAINNTGWAANVGIHGLCKVGSDIYVIVQDYDRLTPGTFYGKWYIYRINGSTFNKTSEIFIGEQGFFGGTAISKKPAMAEIGGLPSLIYQNVDNDLVVRRWDVALTAQVGVDRVILTPANPWKTKDAHYGVHGPAGSRRLYVSSLGYPKVLVFEPSVAPTTTNNPTWTRITNEEFTPANNAEINGLAFDTRAESGSVGKTGTVGNRFQSYGPTNLMYDYGRNHTQETVRTQHAWYDGTGTTHKTEGGPEYVYTRPARSAMVIETEAAPDVNNNDAGNVDKANQIILYAAVGETPKQQAILPIGTRRQYFWNTVPHTGATPSLSNEFASAGVTPGVLKSTYADSRGNMVKLSGAGSGRVGPLEWDVNNKITRDSGDIGTGGGTFTGSVRAVRVGQIVYLTGGIGRATSFQTGFNNTGVVLPADFRPGGSRYSPGFIGHNTASTYQFRVDSDGNVLVRQSGAIGVDMQCNFFFFVD